MIDGESPLRGSNDSPISKIDPLQRIPENDLNIPVGSTEGTARSPPGTVTNRLLAGAEVYDSTSPGETERQAPLSPDESNAGL